MRVDVGDGVRLFMDVIGSALARDADLMRERPVLLALHGGPGFDHSTMRPWFDRFADTHQVIYLDHRGNGRSDGHQDPDGWTMDVWADDVARLCVALDVPKVTVLGLSFGGAVAIHVAARHSYLVERLVVISSNVTKDLPAMLEVFERRRRARGAHGRRPALPTCASSKATKAWRSSKSPRAASERLRGRYPAPSRIRRWRRPTMSSRVEGRRANASAELRVR